MNSASERCSWRPVAQLRHESTKRWQHWTKLGCLMAFCVAGAAATPVCAQADGDQQASGNKPARQVGPAQATSAQAGRIQELIDQLGSERFQEREAASAELLAVGEPALLALAAAEQDSDAELRQRARSIRERIERDKFEALSQSFMRDPDPTASYGMPGWAAFSQAAGSTRTAKRLFLEMVEKRRLVALCLESVEGGSVPAGVFEGLPSDPQQRLWTVVGAMCREVRESLYQKGNRPLTGDCIALLAAATALKNPPQDLHDTIKSEFQFGGFQKLLIQPNSRVCTRKMLGKWFLKAPVTMAEDVISIAFQTQVPEGADMARRLLATPAEPASKAQALLCLAKFGSSDDLDLIDKFVDDATVLETFEQDVRGDDIREERIAPPLREEKMPEPAAGGQRRKYQRTLGDVALAAGLKLAGFDLLELFPLIDLDEMTGMRETTIGFPIDKPEMRAAALKTWRDYRAKKTSPPPAAAQPAS